jgi:uncharacterized protein (DUF2225 family)
MKSKSGKTYLRSHVECPICKTKISRKFIWLSNAKVYECKECKTKLRWTWARQLAAFLGMTAGPSINYFIFKPRFENSFELYALGLMMSLITTSVFFYSVIPYQLSIKTRRTD